MNEFDERAYDQRMTSLYVSLPSLSVSLSFYAPPELAATHTQRENHPLLLPIQATDAAVPPTHNIQDV